MFSYIYNDLWWNDYDFIQYATMSITAFPQKKLTFDVKICSWFMEQGAMESRQGHASAIKKYTATSPTTRIVVTGQIRHIRRRTLMQSMTSPADQFTGCKKTAPPEGGITNNQ